MQENLANSCPSFRRSRGSTCTLVPRLCKVEDGSIGESAARSWACPCRIGMLAYLVIREGSKWTDVFRLVPGQSVTIGRAPTNQIVLKDDRCSRCHAEVFLSEGQWTLRDR